MRQELPYFDIENSYGGNQEWFATLWMRLGGCAAETACDSSIYLALYKGKTNLYPYDAKHLTRRDYVEFSKVMRPYLKPRFSGIDRLEIYQEGLGKYLRDRGETGLQLLAWDGKKDLAATKMVIKQQIDQGYPVPCLILNHANPDFEDYEWHWFLLTGYEETAAKFLVKAVTYSAWKWLDLAGLWNTGHTKKGGLILFREAASASEADKK